MMPPMLRMLRKRETRIKTDIKGGAVSGRRFSIRGPAGEGWDTEAALGAGELVGAGKPPASWKV